jgi:hypothetical protein
MYGFHLQTDCIGCESDTERYFVGYVGSFEGDGPIIFTGKVEEVTGLPKALALLFKGLDVRGPGPLGPLKMKAILEFANSGTANPVTRCRIPEERSPQPHRREYFKDPYHTEDLYSAGTRFESCPEHGLLSVQLMVFEFLKAKTRTDISGRQLTSASIVTHRIWQLRC